MDPHLLRTFVTVVRLSSFSAAAAELGYTQAAVSQQIAALESDLKAVLLNRRPVTPTEAGARLLDHADQILFRLDAARADITRTTQAPSATLVIGITPLAAAPSRLPQALADLRQRMPRLDVTIRLGTHSSVATGVARGELDIALLDGLAASGDSLSVLPPLTAIGVAESPVTVILPTDHPLATRAALSLADLTDARWIDAPEAAPPLSDIRRVTRTEGFRPAFRYEGTDTASLIALAAAGHGLTLLPAPLAGVREVGKVAGVRRVVAGTSECVGIRVIHPRIVHRVELIHGVLRDGSPAAELAALL